MEIKRSVDNHIEPNMMIYSMTTITDRALPDVADGVKPVVRRIVYAMDDAGLNHDKDFVKTSIPISETMKIHSHGDSSIEGAIALLTDKNETLLHPYLDGQGSFGKVYNTDKWSAPRYTFCRLSKFAEDCLLKNINKGIVDFVVESGHKQPLTLPVTFPNILVKANQGIAVGMATNIPSFNLKEVNDLTVKIIKGEELDVIIPDFSSGGECLYNENELRKIFETGYGKVVVRSKWRYNEKDSCIEVYEIPYSTTANAIIEKTTELIKEGKLKDVLDIRDETGFDIKLDKEVLNIAIDIKSRSNPNEVMARLFKMTPLQDIFSVNMNMLVNGEPKVLGVKETILEWLKTRERVLRKEFKIDLDKLEKEDNILSDLEKIINIIDDVVSVIRKCKKKTEVSNSLMERFSLTKDGADYISEIKLGNLNEEWINERVVRLSEVKDKIIYVNDVLGNKDKLNEVIVSQLEEVSKKYGKPRMTTIIYDTDTTIPQDALIEDYNCQLVVTKEGYVKKTSKYSESQKLKDGDVVLSQTATTNKSKILFFTNKANVYFLNMYDLNDCLPSALGQYSYSLLPIESDEKIIYTTVTTDYSGYMYFGFSNGKVCKVPLTSYQTKQNRSKLMNSYNTESPLVYIGHLATDVDFLSKSSDGYYFLASSSLINEKTTRSSQGVTFHKLHPDCKVVEFGINPLSELESRTCTYDSLAKIGKKLNL